MTIMYFIWHGIRGGFSGHSGLVTGSTSATWLPLVTNLSIHPLPVPQDGLGMQVGLNSQACEWFWFARGLIYLGQLKLAMSHKIRIGPGIYERDIG